MKIEVRKCAAAEIFDDPASAALIAEYSEECAIALVGKPAPRRDMYENLEYSGAGQCFSAREDGKLVGFACVVVAVVPHYDLSYAVYESLFVSLGSCAGSELMRVTAEHAAKVGCTSIFCSAPVGSRLARLMFLDSDLWTNTNHVFCRRLVA